MVVLPPPPPHPPEYKLPCDTNVALELISTTILSPRHSFVAKHERSPECLVGCIEACVIE